MGTTAGDDPPCLELQKGLEASAGSSDPAIETCVRFVDCCRDHGALGDGLGFLLDLAGRTGAGKPNLQAGIAYALSLAERPQEAAAYVRKAQREGASAPETLCLAGAVLLEAKDYRGALALLQQARESAGNRADGLLQARVAYNAGLARQSLGQLTEAMQEFRNVLTGTWSSADAGLELRARLGCAQVSLATGETDEALVGFRELLERADNGGEALLRLEAKKGEIAALLQAGAYREAEEICREAVGVSQPAFSADIAGLRTLLGRALFGLGEYEQAEQEFTNSLEAASEHQDLKARLINLVHLGNLAWATDAFHRAAEVYVEVVALGRELNDPLGEGDGRVGQGLVAQSLGLWSDAQTAYEAARRLYQTSGDGQRLGAVLNDLGLIHLNNGGYEVAEERFTEAVSLFRQAGYLMGQALARSNLGELLQRLGRLPEASEELEAAQAVFVRIGARRGEALNSMRLGWLQLGLGAPEKARTWFHACLAPAREIGDRDAEWRALFGLAAASERQGEHARALQEYLDAVQVLEDRYAELGPPTVDLAFRIGAGSLYEAIIRLLVQEHRDAEAFRYLRRDRRRERLERLRMLVPQARGGARDLVQAIQKNRTKLVACYQALGRLDGCHSESARRNRAGIEDRLQRSRRERKRLLEQLRNVDRGLYDRAVGKGVEMSEICARIPADTALIQYYHTGRELLLFALDRHGLRVFRAERTVESLERECRDFQDLLARGELTGPSIRRLRDLGDSLYRTLILPAAAVVGEKRTLGIVPWGVLHQIPFSVLVRREPGGGDRYLLEDHQVFYYNIQDYVRYLAGSEAPAPMQDLVGFADPDGTLPGSREELSAARKAFPDTRLFFGQQATEGRAKELAGSADVLAFAVHGVFNGSGPLGSYLQLAPDEREDGRFTVAEASRLRMDGAPLVVLSTCDSGVGAVVEGYGRVSFSEAFMAAGARSVVTTLWKIDDGATRDFMEAFYAEMKQSQAHEALRTVQLAFLSGRIRRAEGGGRVTRTAGAAVYSLVPGTRDTEMDYTQPYFWAAFVTKGNGQ